VDRPPVVPIGDVSVMPQAWATRRPARMKRSIIARGIAEPPQTMVCKLGGISPPLWVSTCCSRASHTVGTPAEQVTFSRFISSHSTAPSFTAE